MDNISLRRSSDEDGSCTANSMYLSFDAESTMSCYKTMEAMTDISSMSALSIIDEHNDIKHMNSTLENTQEMQSPLKTVKKMEAMTICSPLRALPKNIMREYKALSSTPSRELLLKTVEVTRGSDASRCIDLGVAFLGIDDEQPAYFAMAAKQETRREDNKENTMPESTSDGSTLSVSSSVDIGSSLVDKRLNSVSTTGSLTGDESESAISVIEKPLLHLMSTTESMVSEESKNEMDEEVVLPEVNLETTPKALDLVKQDDEKIVQFPQKDTTDCTPKADNEGVENIRTLLKDNKTPMELNPKVKALTDAKKSAPTSKIAGLSIRNARRSVCVPDLQTNKPSRILMAGCKRQSLLPIIHKKNTAYVEAENEIPLLMNKILKITKSSEIEKENTIIEKKDEEKDMMFSKNEIIAVKDPLQPTQQNRPLVHASKVRNSLAPFNVGDKRPFCFTQRMSVIVKTTLNSPARKVGRKSVLGATNSIAAIQRRSCFSTKSTQTMRMNKMDSGVRRSMLPNTKSITGVAAANSLTGIKETATTQPQKSICSSVKLSEEAKFKEPQPSYVRPKIEAPLTCNVCKEKFRLKSLLDAHKRSHEGSYVTPTIKKQTAPFAPSGSNASSSHNSNQCKYCDKKFALVRALHIHLLQNCPKIPPSEKRKLEYTEMNHVEKARLPSVFNHGTVPSSNASSTQATPRGIVRSSDPVQNPKLPYGFIKKIDPTNKSAELLENKTKEGSQWSNPNAHLAAAGSSQKLKKPSAHSGVYRTPNKTVPCHICKLTFKSILDYTTHSLATHGSKTHQQLADTGGDAAPIK